MPLNILASVVKSLPFDFEQAVKDHIKALEAHRFTTGEAAPRVVHPLVEAAIGRVQYPIDARKPDDFVPVYQIIDDTPILSLEDKKNKLEHELRLEVAPFIQQASGPQRRQLAAHIVTQEAYMTKPEERTDAHLKVIEEHEARAKRLDTLTRYLSAQLVAIEELDESNIDTWKAAPIP